MKTATPLQQETVSSGLNVRQLINRYSTLIALAVLFIIANFVSEYFVQPQNLTNITLQIAVNGILAVGMTMVILTGGIDLGVGSVVGLTGVVLGMTQGYGVVPAILATLATGIIIGLWNALFISRFNIPPFIVTLGMMTIARGFALYLSNGAAVSLNENKFYEQLGTGFLSVNLSAVLLGLIALFVAFVGFKAMRQKSFNLESVISFVLSLAGIGLFSWAYLSYQGVPYLVLVFAVIVLWGIWVLTQTTFGRYLYAIGGNAKAAYLSGVNVKKNLVKVYVTSSVLAAIAGIIMTTRVGSADPNGGNMFELDAVAAAVIGGTSLAGGFGTIGGAMIGAFIIGILNNILILANVNPYFQFIFKGLIIIAAVLLDMKNKQQK
ncbi:sugar ABC transporter permease [Tumebacillus permanentifrigoris]|uniref:Xylose ABC transporter membrane protein n=1 Tax=Tumebacillus permanentifrigoris TaxID=378543 RepID=A0A316DCX7_9BACL|nr:inner-membrane translocator [Tumebacillus permanentifrigoris]PWK16037.1 xylose ABC transporter membrane protein [Tumebacillus permanentifrigoris]